MIDYNKNEINIRDLYIEKIQAVEKKRNLEKRVTEIKANNSNSDNDSDRVSDHQSEQSGKKDEEEA